MKTFKVMITKNKRLRRVSSSWGDISSFKGIQSSVSDKFIKVSHITCELLIKIFSFSQGDRSSFKQMHLKFVCPNCTGGPYHLCELYFILVDNNLTRSVAVRYILQSNYSYLLLVYPDVFRINV